ncbi:MAG: MarR family winged helix-turn-helix transcriptional regulator [Caldisericia bacterium]
MTIDKLISFNNISVMIVSNENIWNDSRFIELKDRVGEGAVLITLLIHVGTLLKSGGDKVFDSFGLSTESYEVLFIVRACKETRPSDLAEYTLMHPAKTTRVIDSLIDKKYIERVYDKKDRRSYYLILTDSGENILKECDKANMEVSNVVKNKFEPDTYNMLINILFAMMKAMKHK